MNRPGVRFWQREDDRKCLRFVQIEIERLCPVGGELVQGISFSHASREFYTLGPVPVVFLMNAKVVDEDWTEIG